METEAVPGRSVTGASGALLALFLVAAGAGAQEDLYERPVVLPVPNDASVEVERDLTYKPVDGEDLQMDVYRPEDRSPDSRLPAVVFVHGGPVAGLPGPAKDAVQFTSYGPLVAATGDPLPRIVVARAGRDFAPLNQALDEFVTAALAANAPLDLMNYPRGEHTFDVLNDDARSRAILRRTLEIVEEVLSTDGS